MITIPFFKKITPLICTALTFFLSVYSVISQTDKVRIAFVGNSITAGVYDFGKTDVEVSFATQFSHLAEDHVDTLETFNAGVSGCTLSKNTTSPIWAQDKFKNSLAWAPDICLIALGTNDSKPSRLDVVQSDFFNDYQDMIDTFKFINPNTTFVVCLPPPIFDGHPYSASDPHNDTILVKYTIPLIDSVAKVNDLIVVDFHTPFVDSLQYFDDKLHPNEAGHQKMAKILFDRFIEEGILASGTTHTYNFYDKPDRKALVYPNPSQTTCTVKVPDAISGVVDFHIFDTNGSAILVQRNLKEKIFPVDVSGMNEGLYFISIKSGEKIMTDKLIIFK